MNNKYIAKLPGELLLISFFLVAIKLAPGHRNKNLKQNRY